MKPWVTCVVALLVVYLPCSAPQFTSASDQPHIKDSLRLTNILMERPIEGPSLRKDCRLLSAEEFQSLVNAVNAAKRDTRVRPNVHDAFAYLHAHPDINKGAHLGPSFLPYHRVFLFLYEKLLRIYNRNVSLCYWDSTSEPEKMTWSPTWTPELFGNVQGLVSTGFAKGWVTPLRALDRQGGVLGRPLTDEDVRIVLTKSRLGEISMPAAAVDANVELMHNYAHTYVGGIMGQVQSAAYDPIFWFHHSFIDCIYDKFLKKQRKLGIDPMRDWPVEHGDNTTHGPFAPMRLGSLRNIDGAQEFFSREIVRCEPMPVCTVDDQCGEYMRCDKSRQKCISDTLRPATEMGPMWSSVENLLASLQQTKFASQNDPLAASSFGFGFIFQQMEQFAYPAASKI
ncbi:tyrosinase-like protein [Biomphalaria glabrata]|uniref:Tyrosinase-like protein n=1 Tax=Biomphalaria glabrata TaxID=6526 RepID=A0A9W3AZ70_BIOGL|nr:tyrosinase-like protein [Biomphalaria glabrata]XP_055892519.1 tyrosinase-like protein [Biomphalaria glabrata]